jgi:Mrp family chromosome partitioning ATPase
LADCNTCPTKGTCNSKEKCTFENNPLNNVKKVIAVMSGKGGVGKSTVSALIAKSLAAKGNKVGILDADITGPSMPRLLRISDQRAYGNEQGINPVKSDEGISVISLNLMTEDEEQPVLWRGPMISGAVKQF